VLAELGGEVSTIEVVPELAERARAIFAALGLDRIEVRTGDGYRGWPERAPFDKVIVTAAPPALPEALVEQLAIGGIMVVPVGPALGDQELRIVRKTPRGVVTERSLAVRFVPMVEPER
jgi:protein-L-isoaspartate(D-aspartate) O-methyltransferase